VTAACVSSCWVGDRLLPIANACVNSFGAHGFSFRLYTYGPVQEVPAFVELSDAAAIVPGDRIFVAHGGLETFADLFAYRFLEGVGGWWVDNDVVCNSALLPDVPIAFAEERPGVINNAVLKFPPGHPAIAEVLDHIANVDAANAPWGSTGPLALSHVFPRHDLTAHRRPTAEFYPLHWKEAPKLLFREFDAEIRVRTAHSPLIHLWGSALREIGFDFRRSCPPDGSYLEWLYGKHLDSDVAGQLRPLDEPAFRRHVQAYVEAHWGVSLPLT
jgi:hypothetical protein